MVLHQDKRNKNHWLQHRRYIRISNIHGIRYFCDCTMLTNTNFKFLVTNKAHFHDPLRDILFILGSGKSIRPTGQFLIKNFEGNWPFFSEFGYDWSISFVGYSCFSQNILAAYFLVKNAFNGCKILQQDNATKCL